MERDASEFDADYFFARCEQEWAKQREAKAAEMAQRFAKADAWAEAAGREFARREEQAAKFRR